ncbi:MAG TPA: DUF502 domain-containing protein [Thermoanaerobaculia bacterium]|nr:DUF502 domain-containing protein [Thermoanaerobaculia bacterium]
MWPSGALPSPPGTGWRHRLRRVFLTGLLILAPVALTIFVLVQLFQVMDGIFAPLVDRVLATALGREVVRIPGLGLLLTLCVVLLLGWLSTHVGGRRLLRWMEEVIQSIPVAKSIYNATKGILEAVSRDQADAFKRVILIEYPKKDIFALAFVTAGARWGHVDERLGDLLLVFVPTTPNPTSGFLLLVPRGEAIELPISVEEGVRMVISGGILLPRPQGIDPGTYRPVPDAELVATPSGTNDEAAPGAGRGEPEVHPGPTAHSEPQGVPR